MFINTSCLRDNQYFYYSTSDTSDTVGDIRTYKSSGVFRIETCLVANATKGGGTWVVTESKRTISLTDNNEGTPSASTSIDLATSKSGIGRLVFGNGIGYADFIFTTAGVVTFLNYSGNVCLAAEFATGTNMVSFVTVSSTTVRIINELSATTTFTLIVNYTV